MMSEFVEQDRGLLRFFCRAVQFFGWVVVAGGAVWFIGFVSRPAVANFEDPAIINNILYAVSAFAFDFFFVCLASVILAQLARYFFEGEGKPGLLLRCGDKILYAFAVLGILWAVGRHLLNVWLIPEAELVFLYWQALLLPTIAKVLILVGLGQVLKRILPIIEESKTLV